MATSATPSQVPSPSVSGSISFYETRKAGNAIAELKKNLAAKADTKLGGNKKSGLRLKSGTIVVYKDFRCAERKVSRIIVETCQG